MDQIDRKIIAILEHDSRISVTDLADRIHVSISATSERLRRLRSSGLISRFTIELDPAATGRRIDAVVDVRLARGTAIEPFDSALIGLEAVVNALHLTGPFDYQLRVQATDVAELDHLLTILKSELGVAETNTRLVLRTVHGFPRTAPVV